MDLILKILASLTGILGFLFILHNWYAVYSSYKLKTNSSTIPFGGLLLTIGMISFDSLRPYSFFGLVVDIGTYYGVLGIGYMIKESWRISGFRRLRKFEGEKKNIAAALTLYKGETWLLRIDVDLPKNQGNRVLIF